MSKITFKSVFAFLRSVNYLSTKNNRSLADRNNLAGLQYFLGLEAPFLQFDNSTALAAVVVDLVLGGDADS